MTYTRFALFFLTFLLLSSCGKNNTDSLHHPPQSPQKNTQQILTINIHEDPETLDPRKARDLTSKTLCRMFFEGLTRINDQGKPALAVAEKYDLSTDKNTYVFTLRESYWSNGDPVTAYDFEYTWKKILDPSFLAPEAAQLFVIKNASAVKEGTQSPRELGVRALDDNTLLVELEQPTPYFLELTAFRTFLPINSKIDRVNPQWPLKDDKTIFSSNGPFVIESWDHHNLLEVRKNENYWDADAVQLNTIRMTMVPTETALKMFENGELDWAGSPLDIIPTDAIATFKQQNLLHSQPAAATEIYRINTKKPPFNNVKMRKAFAYAINRQAITKHVLQSGQTAALAFIPPSKAWETKPYFADNNTSNAKQLFEEGLQELGITQEELPEITLSYPAGDRNHTVAQVIQQDWHKAFGVTAQLESVEAKVFWDKLRQQDHQIARGSWFADIGDPIDFLNVFKYRHRGTNNTGWEDPVYAKLLDMSETEEDPENRQEVLALAEQILMDEMPVIPIFHYTLSYIKKPELQGVYLSELGWMDFTHAYFE